MPDFVNPLVHEGDVTFEKQLPMNMSFTAAYVVSRALHLPIYVDANLAPSTTTKTYDITNAAGVTQSTVTLPFYTTRLNPGTGDILTGYSDVNSWYNSMVLTLRKRMSHGFEFLANYTLAGPSTAVRSREPSELSSAPIRPSIRRTASSNTGLRIWISDTGLSGRAVWAPPFSKISNRPARLLVDGFNFSTIITAATGQPLTEYISGFPSRRAGRRIDGRHGYQLGRNDGWPGAVPAAQQLLPAEHLQHRFPDRAGISSCASD